MDLTPKRETIISVVSGTFEEFNYFMIRILSDLYPAQIHYRFTKTCCTIQNVKYIFCNTEKSALGFHPDDVIYVGTFFNLPEIKKIQSHFSYIYENKEELFND